MIIRHIGCKSLVCLILKRKKKCKCDNCNRMEKIVDEVCILCYNVTNIKEEK